jgi:(2S)-methylsuccinyl-CoA dehydrogenase
MSTSPTSSPFETPTTARLLEAVRAVEATRGLVDQAFSLLKAKVLDPDKPGRVSNARMDEHQYVSFELAWSASEVTAAEAVLAWADRARAAKKIPADATQSVSAPILEERLATAYAAEVTASVRGRLLAHAEDFGLSLDLIVGTLVSGATAAFVGQELSSANLAAIGEMIRDQQGNLGLRLLSEDAEMMRTTFRTFADKVVKPLAEEIHREDQDIPDAIFEPLVELGCFGLCIPEKYGGFTSDEHEDNQGMIVVTEELSRGSLGAAGSLITRPEIVTRALLAGGTEAQREQWLPQFASGEKLVSVAATEPDYGSDVAGMRFKATRTQGGWFLDGAKSWCTFGGRANVMLVLARTDPDLSKGHRGLSLFLVEKPSFPGHAFSHVFREVNSTGADGEGKSKGAINGRAIPTIGYRGMHSFDVFFEEVFVPDENLIGGEAGLGKGFYYQMAGFSGGRIQTAARAVGVMQAAFEASLTYASDRKVFGKALGDYELSQVKLARMGMQLLASRQFTYGVGTLMDAGGGQIESSMVKLLTCRLAEQLTREAVQIHGGMGYAEETAVSRYFLDARVLSIFEGAEEVLAMKVIARSLVDQAR